MQIQIGVMFFISHATLCLLRCTLFMHGVCVCDKKLVSCARPRCKNRHGHKVAFLTVRCVMRNIWASAFEVRRPIFHTVSMAMCLSRDQRRPPTNDMTPVLRQQHVLRRWAIIESAKSTPPRTLCSLRGRRELVALKLIAPTCILAELMRRLAAKWYYLTARDCNCIVLSTCIDLESRLHRGIILKWVCWVTNKRLKVKTRNTQTIIGIQNSKNSGIFFQPL